MFIGHYGVALAGKKLDQRPSLGTMFLAAQFLDVLWPVFILLGIEHVSIVHASDPFLTLDFTYYPFSHSLLASAVWGALFGLGYYLIRKNLKGAVILGILVVSHWILDLIVHVPDLPLVPGGGPKVGMGMWDSVGLTVAVEGLIFILGAWLYVSSSRNRNLRGSLALWGLLFFLMLAYVSNLFAPPPTSVTAIGVVGLSQWLIIAWGYWVDRNRTPLTAAP